MTQTRKLPETQVALLNAASANEAKTIEELSEETGLKPEEVTHAAFSLHENGLIELGEISEYIDSLTEEGKKYAQDGLPEHRLYQAAVDVGATDNPVPMEDVIDKAELDDNEVDIALSNYARKGCGSIKEGKLSASHDIDLNEDEEWEILQELNEYGDGTLKQTAIDTAKQNQEPEELYLGKFPKEVVEQLERRGLITHEEVVNREVILSDAGVDALMAGAVEVAEAVDRVTPELLTSGEWRDVEFAEYNVEADAGTYNGGTEHILRQTANRVKDVLVGMGFKEMQGPHADADFWINDCLFMPQDHPARTHWDRFPLDVPPIRDLPEDLVERVRSAHLEGVGEDGDGYHSPWDEDFARAIALRGHTTSLSMRYLSGHAVGDLDPPERYFSVEKVYRNDTLDPTHLLEFFQVEGWVMAADLSVRDLMGTFEEFYEQFGITNLRYKPHYNPYTEPSFELFVDHPETGETIELGNSGIFREEVLQPLGVDSDVMAWGISLERLLMVMYGFEDIRDVHGTLCDLDLLRSVEVVR